MSYQARVVLENIHLFAVHILMTDFAPSEKNRILKKNAVPRHFEGNEVSKITPICAEDNLKTSEHLALKKKPTIYIFYFSSENISMTGVRQNRKDNDDLDDFTKSQN
ncbi:hypothetical protein DMN91_012907 [Ooceraea biroi]|uniref:Uncharacterized protein n=1 Tax=Ooceraea biroi TaxID=2015173 RepID=A0A3L8D3P8_OOCBI|nr:uncharacterized protein LOC105280006 isoform X1 [Ooceraea biroi]RLU15020.1 hypothetical protein DMN91_012907 [Ooceraea biroi]